jgi:hypothetical protein
LLRMDVGQRCKRHFDLKSGWCPHDRTRIDSGSVWLAAPSP